MNKLLVDMSRLFYAPRAFSVQCIQNNTKSSYVLVLAVLALALCALSYYIGWFKAFVGHSMLAVFGIQAFFFIALFGLIVLLEVAVTNLFSKKNHAFYVADVCLIVGASYCPYALLAAVSTLYLDLFLFVCVHGVIMALSFSIRYKIVRDLQDHFTHTAWIVTFMPIIFQFSLFVVGGGLVGMTVVSSLISAFYVYGF